MTTPIDRWTVAFSNICRKAIMSEDMPDWSGYFRKNKEHQFEFHLELGSHVLKVQDVQEELGRVSGCLCVSVTWI